MLGPQGTPEQPEAQAQLEIRVRLVRKVRLGLRAQRVTPGQQVTPAYKDYLGQRAILATREPRALG